MVAWGRCGRGWGAWRREASVSALPPVRARLPPVSSGSCSHLPLPTLREVLAVTLERRTPLRAKPRSKGNRAEREVIDILKAHGWTGARRNFQSGGQGGGDVIGGPEGCNVEVKHREACRIWDWIAQSEADARPTELPLVVFRRNRSGWYACLPLEELLPLLAMRERS